MRLYQQLVLFMLAATVLPLALVGFWLLRGSELELEKRIQSEQRALALATAERAGTELIGTVEAIARSAEMIDWRSATPEEVRGGLTLLYGQSPAVSAVLLVGADGEPISSPVFLEEGDSGHPGFHPAALSTLTRAIPLEPLRRGGKGQAAISPAYQHSKAGVAAMAVAVKLASDEAAPFALAEVALTRVSEEMAARASKQSGRIDLVDADGRVVASSDPSRVLTMLEPALWSALEPQLPRTLQPESSRVQLPARTLVSAARVPQQLGLFAVVSVDERVALQPVRAMRRTVLIGIGAAMTVLLLFGFFFTRRLNGRLGNVVRGAEAYAQGELSHRIPVEGADELTELAETFNRMGGELEISRAKLMRWNDELRQKVDEATADLRAAQAQLLEAQKLAAVGQLGAGVAHEINNPLAGILGNAQLLMLERTDADPDFGMLKKIEQSAKRCKEITQSLLRFSQQKGPGELRPVDLNGVVRDVIGLSSDGQDGVTVKTELTGAPLMVKADPSHLSQVVLALVSNARTAMSKSEMKTLTLRTRADGEEIVLEVADTGKGIKPEHLGRIFEPFFSTKDVWSNVGLGLSVAYRVINEHHGRLDVTTEVGKGSTFTVTLPSAASANAITAPKPKLQTGTPTLV